VNLVRSSGDGYVFRLGRREKALLLEILDMYPRVPPGHHAVSQGAEGTDTQVEQQRLLEESLAEHRAENKRHLKKLLSDPGRFRLDPLEKAWLFSIGAGDLEWLLQVLNDIRVGSWVRLGSPQAKLEMKLLNPKTAPDFWAMEISGHFQMELLQALRRPS